MIEKMAPQLDCAKVFIVMGDQVPPDTKLSPIYAYEELLRDASPDFPWPRLDENDAAAMCYTSGTTGNPKGVVYSHRSIYLHSLGLCMADSFGMAERDTFMPVVPMFHVLAWGTPFAGTMVGVKWVLPGPHMTPRDLAEIDPGRAGDADRGRADAMAGAAEPARPRALRPQQPAHDDRRRRGRAAVDDRGVREEARPDRDARLGHDRDVAAGHGQPAAELARGPARS